MKRFAPALLAIFSAMTMTSVAAAQAVVRGAVVDDSGAVLPGAAVVLTLEGAGNPRETTSDRSGAFSFSSVPEGPAHLRIELSGFQAADIKISVSSSHATEVAARLKIGFDEEVTVSPDASGSVLSPSKNADAVEFDPETLRRLPTNAQDLQSLVESFTAAGPVSGVSVVVDGTETDALGIPASAIHRLYINRNPYSAEFKSPGKSRVEVETERGSRRFYHGSGALFLRNSALQARNAFASSTPAMNRALNEGTLGGPLPGKAWSFFASGQQLVNNESAVINAQTPGGPVLQNVSTPERRATLLGRIDFRPNKTDAVTLRYDLFDDVERNHGVGGFRLADQAYATTERRHRVQASDHRVVFGNALNDLRIEAAASERADGAMPQTPSIVVPGAFTSGASQSFKRDRSISIQAQEISSLTIAAHPVRFGVRVKARWIDAFDATNFGGTFHFQGLADFARGTPLLFVRRSGNAGVSFGDADGSVFTEATFRPADSLSITTGVRYDWQARVDDRNNVAPRIAAAFAPAGKKTVLRAGVGLFYHSLPEEAVERALLFGANGLREQSVPAPSFPSVSGDSLPDGPVATWRLQPSLGTPVTVQASVGAERALWPRSSISVEYLVLGSTHALRARDINAPLPVSLVRPDPTRLGVFQIQASGSGQTDALTATFRGRLAGFRGTIQYTLSRATDDGSGVFDLPADSYNLDAERGRADFDRRHRFNLAGTYGWLRDRLRVGGVLAAWSGAPFDIVTGADTNHDLIVNDRPAGMTRNLGNGPSFAQLDLRFTSVFRAPRPPSQDPESAKREQTDNLELIVDVFNALNRVNATTFVGVIMSPLFGQANAARTPRTAQISLRYRF